MKWTRSGWFVALLLLLITALHMTTARHSVLSHNLYRRLYYLPIILAAFRYGTLGGGLAALGASLLYTPHAFFMGHHADPAPAGDKLLEMLLFGVVGLMTGALVQRERKAYTLRRQAEAHAERLASLVTLTSGLAHEVRNPLASIQGAFEILSDDYPPDAPKRRILDVGLQETARLDRVLGDFIAFAKTQRPRPKRVELATLVRRVADTVSLTREGVTVRVVSPVESVEVMVDPDLIQQCLMNLALNAAQWSPNPGEVLLRLSGGRKVVLEVEDRGPGIPDDERERIFDPYFTRRKGGTGLGLAVAARIAAAHGGTLDYEPREGGGSRFRLALGADR